MSVGHAKVEDMKTRSRTHSNARPVGVSEFTRGQRGAEPSSLDEAPREMRWAAVEPVDLSDAVAAWLADPEVEAEVEAQLDKRGGRAATVYWFLNSEGRLLYVGVTARGHRRMHQHAASKDWWPQVATATFRHFTSRREAVAVEKRAIRNENPLHNIVGVQREADGQNPWKSPVQGVRPDAAYSTIMEKPEIWAALERQSARHFGMGAEELISKFESGEIPRTDPRLRFVVNLFSALGSRRAS